MSLKKYIDDGNATIQIFKEIEDGTYIKITSKRFDITTGEEIGPVEEIYLIEQQEKQKLLLQSQIDDINTMIDVTNTLKNN